MTKQSICSLCIVNHVISGEVELGAAGLIWIGEQYYATTEAFTREAEAMGISRRIATVPRDFRLGETYVLLAHRSAITRWEDGQMPYTVPGIFRIWLPDRIEVIVDGTESDEVIDGYLDRDLTPIKVEVADWIEQGEMELT